MQSCICTIIKNEHQYLDEWIQYHLNLGIDFIFIFEDIDSESHKNIVDKYSKSVSLNSINTVLDNAGQLIAKSLKIQKRFNALHLYFKSIINYILQNFPNKYNWCFILDIDEFITLTNNNKLSDILDLYRNYDAFTLSWKCYGANGYINTPTYENGVIDTYTKEISGNIPDNEVSFRKTCYNLDTYKSEFFYNLHYPTDKCNWVNTKFEKDKIFNCYENIYIRHYITKSWEEYIWKIKQRGFMWGRNRGIDFFFAVNKDMEDKREELVNSIEEVLVVLPYIHSYAQGNELELSLSCWKKFCTFKYHFIVIGEFDNTIKDKFPWVEFIECERVSEKEDLYTPHLDIQHKMEIIMNKYKSLYRGFIRMMDDIYAVKPFSFNDILFTHYNGEYIIGNEKSSKASWTYDNWKTCQLLKLKNLPYVDYATHYPSYFEFEKLNIIWDIFNMRNESYTYEDLYFNYFPHEKPILVSYTRLGIWNDIVFKMCFKTAMNNPNIKFMCNSTKGWSKDVEDVIFKIINIKN